MTLIIKHCKAPITLFTFYCRARANVNNTILVMKFKKKKKIQARNSNSGDHIFPFSSRVWPWLTCKRLRKQSAGVVPQRPGRRRRRRKRSRTRRSRRWRRRRRPRKTITDRSTAASKRYISALSFWNNFPKRGHCIFTCNLHLEYFTTLPFSPPALPAFVFLLRHFHSQHCLHPILL